jgi:hypothetical protein
MHGLRWQDVELVAGRLVVKQTYVRGESVRRCRG